MRSGWRSRGCRVEPLRCLSLAGLERAHVLEPNKFSGVVSVGFFTAAVWCVPALRVPLVHSQINHFRQKKASAPLCSAAVSSSGCTGDRRGLLCNTQGGQALACPIRSRSGLLHPEDLARALDHLHVAHGRQREAGLAELGLQAGAERGQQHGLPRGKAGVGVEVGGGGWGWV